MVVGTREGITPSRGLLTTLAGKKVFESSVALLSRLARNIESMRFGTMSRSTCVSSSCPTSPCVSKVSGLCAVRFYYINGCIVWIEYDVGPRWCAEEDVQQQCGQRPEATHCSVWESFQEDGVCTSCLCCSGDRESVITGSNGEAGSWVHLGGGAVYSRVWVSGWTV